MNLYAHVGLIKSRLGISSAADDGVLLGILEAVSREVDDCCRRVFYTETGVRYFTAQSGDRCLVDDLLTLTALAVDEAQDGLYSRAWDVEDDVLLDPMNRWPKATLRRPVWGAKYFPQGERAVKVTGIFGYGSGLSNLPWKPLGLTGTVASADGTTLTLSASSGVSAGMTLLAGTEQLYVEAVSGSAATVARGVNGTTAAAHSAAALRVAQYPATVVGAVLYLGASLYNLRDKGGLKDVMIGEYRETLVWDDRIRDQMSSMLGTLKRPMLCEV